jgi:ABC-type xylose transport system permease subunit
LSEWSSCSDLALGVLAAVASGVLGAFVCVLLMGSLNNGMSPMNLPTFCQDAARGIILLLAVTVDQLAGRRGDEHQQSHWPDP